MEPARRFLNGGAECEKPGSGQLRVVWVETGHSVEEGALRKCRMLTTIWAEATCGVVESSTSSILSRVQEKGPFLDCSNIGG